MPNEPERRIEREVELAIFELNVLYYPHRSFELRNLEVIQQEGRLNKKDE